MKTVVGSTLKWGEAWCVTEEQCTAQGSRGIRSLEEQTEIQL